MALREARDRAFFESYTREIARNDFRTQEEAINFVRTHSAPRFYIDGLFCHIVLSQMRRGLPLGVSGEAQIRKFQELNRRYEAERANPKRSGLSSVAICDIIVEQPAPEFYISYRSARAIISKERELKCLELLKRRR